MVLLVAAISGCAAQPARQGSSSGQAQPTLVPTPVAAAKSTYTVERGEVVYDVDFSGRIAPVIEETLSYPIDGVISTVYVDRGDTVAAGDPIADLDTVAILEALTQAQSELAIAEARLNSTIAQNERDRRRAEIRLEMAQVRLDQAAARAGEDPSEEEQYALRLLELDRALKQLDVDELVSEIDPALQANVDAAALQVAELEDLLSRASLVAPFDGQLTAFTAVPGFAVSALAPIGVVVDTSQTEVSASLRDAQMEELSEGMPVMIALANQPGDAYPATVARLPYPFGSGGGANIEETDTTTRFTFDNPEDASSFDLGERVSVNVVIEAKPDTLLLPEAAIRDFNGRKFVIVQNDGVQQRVDVTLGISGDGVVEILDGLTEGQVVVGQ